MKRRLFLALGLFLALPQLAAACEPPTIYYLPYMADLKGASDADVTDFVRTTKPVVKDTYLSRGTAGEQSLCGGQGYISVDLTLPPGAPFAFGQVGVELKLVEGRFPGHVFPNGPVMPDEAGTDTLQLGNSWFEGPPETHRTISAVFNATLVAPDGTRGPATRIVIKSVPKRTGKKEELSR